MNTGTLLACSFVSENAIVYKRAVVTETYLTVYSATNKLEDRYYLQGSKCMATKNSQTTLKFADGREFHISGIPESQAAKLRPALFAAIDFANVDNQEISTALGSYFENDKWIKCKFVLAGSEISILDYIDQPVDLFRELSSSKKTILIPSLSKVSTIDSGNSSSSTGTSGISLINGISGFSAISGNSNTPPLFQIFCQFTHDSKALLIGFEQKEQRDYFHSACDAILKDVWGVDVLPPSPSDKTKILVEVQFGNLSPTTWTTVQLSVTDSLIKVICNSEEILVFPIIGTTVQRTRMICKANTFMITYCGADYHFGCASPDEVTSLCKDLHAIIVQNTTATLKKGHLVCFTVVDKTKGVVRITLSSAKISITEMHQWFNKVEHSIPLSSVQKVALSSVNSNLTITHTSADSNNNNNTNNNITNNINNYVLNGSGIPLLFPIIDNISGGVGKSPIVGSFAAESSIFYEQKVIFNLEETTDGLSNGEVLKDLVVALLTKDTGVRLKTRSLLGKSFPNTFTGQELVDWMKDHEFLNTAQSLEVGQKLLDYHYISHKSSDKLPFTRACWYSFTNTGNALAGAQNTE